MADTPGCCWQFNCNGDAPFQVVSAPTLAVQCPFNPGHRLFVPGACSTQVPTYACHTGSGSASGSGSHSHSGSGSKPHPDPDEVGCCWQYRCDDWGTAENIMSGHATAVQCPTVPGVRTFVPGACTLQPPKDTFLCLVPSGGGSGSGSGHKPNPPPKGYDGVMLMIRLTSALRAAFPKATGFLISHAPQTPYLTLSTNLVDGSPVGDDSGYMESPNWCYGAYLPILATVGSDIDFLNVQAYNNKPLTGCPITPILLNNLMGLPSAPGQPRGVVYPSPLPSYFGNQVMAPLKAHQLVLGQQIPASAGDSGPMKKAPVSDPWCRGTQTPLNPASGVGLMYWLNDPAGASRAAADASVDLWYPTAKSSGLLSPPDRVVYYCNGCGAYEPPLEGYSQCNTIIIGFIYPATTPGRAPSELCAAKGLPAWACFGFFVVCGRYGSSEPISLGSSIVHTGLNAAHLLQWRNVEPTRRKIMVGLGGAFDTPPYELWSQGDNVSTVVTGLQVFMEDFKASNGFALDGIDIDYEDTNALANHALMQQALAGAGGDPAATYRYGLQRGAGAGAAVAGAAVAGPRRRRGVFPAHSASVSKPLYGTVGGGFALAVMVLIVVLIVVGASVPATRQQAFGTPGSIALMTLVGAVAVVGIALVAANVQTS